MINTYKEKHEHKQKSRNSLLAEDEAALIEKHAEHLLPTYQFKQKRIFQHN